jgi:hypothetical protein
MIKEAILGVLAYVVGGFLLLAGFIGLGTSNGNTILIVISFIMLFFGFVLIVVGKKLTK